MGRPRIDPRVKERHIRTANLRIIRARLDWHYCRPDGSTLDEILDILLEYTTVYYNGTIYQAYTLAAGHMHCGNDQNAAAAALRLALSLSDPSRLDTPTTEAIKKARGEE